MKEEITQKLFPFYSVQHETSAFGITRQIIWRHLQDHNEGEFYALLSLFNNTYQLLYNQK